MLSFRISKPGFRGEFAAASLKLVIFCQLNHWNAGVFPRRIRRGLIEALITSSPTSCRRIGFRGEFAAASLKRYRNHPELSRPAAARFRGEFAAASLKRVIAAFKLTYDLWFPRRIRRG